MCGRRRIKLLTAQLSLLVFAGLVVSELYAEVGLAQSLWLSGKHLWAAVAAGVLLNACLLRGLFLLTGANRTVRSSTPSALLYVIFCSLHLDLLVDVVRLLARPTWASLHLPRYMHPFITFFMATLNSMPQLVIHAYLMLGRGGHVSATEALSLVSGSLSVAWVLVTFELTDLKHRQVVKVE